MFLYITEALQIIFPLNIYFYSKHFALLYPIDLVVYLSK